MKYTAQKALGCEFADKHSAMRLMHLTAIPLTARTQHQHLSESGQKHFKPN